MATLLTDEDVGLGASSPAPSGVLSDEDVGLSPGLPADLRPQVQAQGPTQALAAEQVRRMAQNSVVGGPPRPDTVQERAQDIFQFEDLANRGILYPVGRTQQGEATFATPQIVKDMLEGYVGGGMGAAGEPLSYQDVTRSALDVGLPAMAPASKAPFMATNRLSRSQIRETAPGTEELKETATRALGEATGSGMTIGQPANARLFSEIDRIGKEEYLTPELHTSTAGALKGLVRRAGEPQNVMQLTRQRQLLQDAVGAAIKSGNQGDARIAMRMLEAFDDQIENLDPADLVSGAGAGVAENLAKFRLNWSRAKKSQTIENAVYMAGTGATGFENGLKTEIRKIMRRPALNRGFTKDEKQVMQDFLDGKDTDIPKFLGHFGPKAGTNRWLGTILGSGAGAAVAGPAGALAAPAIGYMAGRAADDKAMQAALYMRGLAATGGVAPGSENLLMKGLRTQAPIMSQLGGNRLGGPAVTAIPQGLQTRPAQPPGQRVLPFQPYNPNIL